MKKSKLFKKVFGSALLLVAVFIAGLATLIFFPQTLYAHEMEHRNFKIFAEQSIDQDFTQILDRALIRAAASEIFDEQYKYDIFFSHLSTYDKIDDLVFDPYVAARAIDNNIIVKTPIDIKKGLAYTPESEIDLVYMVVHEMMHCLQAHKYGKLKFNPFKHPPMWKLEGYPEYIARADILKAEDYSLKNEILRYEKLLASSPDYFLPVTKKHSVPGIYFKGRIMVEYLMDIKGLSYTEILEEGIHEEEVYQDMLDWAKTKVLFFEE